ncbi:PD40 domain-containing protein, partial [bacterium]|nr:PD40 domain-containing protein [bacterium]
AAVVLCELDGVSRRDAAGRLGVPEGTISSRLAKGRKLLADRLRKRGVAALGLAALAPAVVPPRLVAAASALASGEPASATVAALAHGVVRAMVLHKFRAVSLALGLVAVVALAAGPSAGQPDIPRPAPALLRVAAQPPAPKAKATPVGIVVARVGEHWRLDPDGKKLDEFRPPEGVRFGGEAAVSPDGVWVAIVGLKDEPPQALQPGVELQPFPLKLVVRRLDGGGEPKVFDLPGFTLEPHWMPDGKALSIAQATNPGRTAYRHATLTPATGEVVPHGDGDGLRILDVMTDGLGFLCEQRDAEKKTAKLVLSRAGDGGIRPLTDLKTPPGFINARLSPDGKRVLFADGDQARKDAHKWGRSHRPYLLDIATGKREALADFPENGQVYGVAWSPDGKRVAYTWTQLHADVLAKERITGEDARRETESFLTVADPDGRNPRTVASDKSQFFGNLVFGQLDWR